MGCVNKQNMRDWVATHSSKLYEWRFHISKETTWCEISAESANCPYFFKNDNVAYVTIKSYRYVMFFELNLNDRKDFQHQVISFK